MLLEEPTCSSETENSYAEYVHDITLLVCLHAGRSKDLNKDSLKYYSSSGWSLQLYFEGQKYAARCVNSIDVNFSNSKTNLWQRWRGQASAVGGEESGRTGR